jgi:hypothetical protein
MSNNNKHNANNHPHHHPLDASAMFGLASTTATGVPLLTMEQIQQLQRTHASEFVVGMQQPQHPPISSTTSYHLPMPSAPALAPATVSSAWENQSLWASSPVAAAGPYQQFLLGNEVSPIVGNTISLNPPLKHKQPHHQHQASTSSLNYEALPDAALWKMFWDETATSSASAPVAVSSPLIQPTQSPLLQPLSLKTAVSSTSPYEMPFHPDDASQMSAHGAVMVRVHLPLSEMWQRDVLRLLTTSSLFSCLLTHKLALISLRDLHQVASVPRRQLRRRCPVPLPTRPSCR